jgi:predicted ATPase
LSTYERELFCKLSVFVGPFTLEAAQSVAGECDDEAQAVSNAIVGLVDKSLISILPTSGPAYFRLLDTTRAYAASKLSESGDAEAVSRRHTCYFAAFLKSSLRTWATSAKRWHGVFPLRVTLLSGLSLLPLRPRYSWSFRCMPSVGNGAGKL